MGREVQLNVSDSAAKDAASEKPTDLGKTLLRGYAVGRKGIGAGQAFVHRRPSAIDVDYRNGRKKRR